MAKKDTVEEQPVSVEEEIASLIDAADKDVVEDEPKEEVEDEKKPEIPEPGDVEDEPAEVEPDEDDDPEGDEGGAGDDETDPEPDDTEGIPGDDQLPEELPELTAPEHWAASDRELFNNQPEEAKTLLLERHKSMEGDYTRKSQEFASDKRQFDAITDSLAPYTAEFQQAGLDHAGAVRQLASWHDSLRSGGRAALLQLASMYNIDMSEAEDQEFLDPSVKALQNEVSQLRAEDRKSVM